MPIDTVVFPAALLILGLRQAYQYHIHGQSGKAFSRLTIRKLPDSASSGTQQMFTCGSLMDEKLQSIESTS